MTPDPDRQAAILNSILEKLNSWEKQREVGFNEVSWCFTPSQPVRLYQGDFNEEEKINS